MKKLCHILILILLFTLTSPLMAQTTLDELENINNTVEIEIPKDSEFEVILMNTISSDKSQPGDTIQFSLAKNISSDDMVIIPRNSIFMGTIIDLSKNALLNTSYNLTIEVNRLSIPFKGDFDIIAHPVFNLEKKKVKRSRRFRFGVAKPSNNDLLETYTKEHLDEPEEQPLLIPKGEMAKIILDKGFQISIKNK